MPGYYKKRRGPHGPNKNEQKVMRARRAETEVRQAGVLGAKFPTVKRLKIHLTFLDGSQRILEEKDLNLGPADAAMFAAPCPGRCGQGAFDFGEKIAEAVSTATEVFEIVVKCGETLYGASPGTCGCELKCRAEMEYLLPAPKPLANG